MGAKGTKERPNERKTEGDGQHVTAWPTVGVPPDKRKGFCGTAAASYGRISRTSKRGIVGATLSPKTVPTCAHAQTL